MKDLILNFLLRMVMGVIGIYACNSLFTASLGLGIHMGINLLNLLTIGILGISGFGLVLQFQRFQFCRKR